MLENETEIPFFFCQSNETNLDKSVCLVYKALNGKVIIADNILCDLDFLLPKEIDNPQHTQTDTKTDNFQPILQYKLTES